MISADTDNDTTNRLFRMISADTNTNTDTDYSE